MQFFFECERRRRLQRDGFCRCVDILDLDQFAKLKTRVEKQTGRTSEQLEHRVKRYKRLSSTPTKQDLQAVAAKLLALRWNSEEQEWTTPGATPNPDLIRVVVGYALTCKMRLPTVTATVDEARCQARKAGRTHIVAADIRTALLDYQVPSDGALQQAFEASNRQSPNQADVQFDSGLTSPLRRPCNSVASPLQAHSRP